ncbi:MAG: hypothetical protein HOW73_23705 [Polyangiaceae bacterium]|nr:hypothetical protein [Polyangiaceae bacterium]
MQKLRFTLCSVFLLSGVVSCGDDSDPIEDPKTESCEVADIDACRIDQKGCALSNGEAACVECTSGMYANEEGSCAGIGGEPLAHDFAEFTTQPGEEVLGLCQSWTLDNDTELWVNAVELEQNEMSHHSNWTFVPEDHFDGPDGVWDCDERNYDQLSAAVAGGVLYAQSTQALREVQKFPDGAAVRIPPRSRIIGDVHLLNVGSEPVTGNVKMTIFTIPTDDVKVKLAPFHMTYDGLAIPPLATSRFEGTCELATKFEQSAGEPIGMKLYYGLPHTHKLGTRFFLQAVGGARDGEYLLDVHGFNGEARGRYYDPPVDLAGITSLRFGCEFQNPRDETVHWGFGDQEMCEMLGFIESPVAFESRVDEAAADGTDGDVQVFTSPCSTIMIPWAEK